MQTKKYFISLILLVALILSACQTAVPASTPVPADPLSAALSDLQGGVGVKSAEAADFAPAKSGMSLQANGIVRTESDGRVRLDLSSGTIVRVAPSSVFTLISNEVQPDKSLVTKIKLELGQIFVVLNGGSAEVETPSGQASVRGSYMMVKIDPETKTVKVTCLEGDCVAKTSAGEVSFAAGQVVILTFGDFPPELGEMSDEDFLEWLSNVPEAFNILSVATATIAARASANPTATMTDTPSPSETPTATSTATPTSSPSATPQECSTLLTPANGATLKAAGKEVFTWTEFPGAAKYKVIINWPNGSSLSEFKVAKPTMTLFVEALPLGGEYNWHVEPQNADEQALCESQSFTFTKPQTPPTVTNTPAPVVIDTPTSFLSPYASLNTSYLPCYLYVNVTPDDPDGGISSVSFYFQLNNGPWNTGYIGPDGATWYGSAQINGISSAADIISLYFSATDGLGNVTTSTIYTLPGGYCP